MQKPSGNAVTAAAELFHLPAAHSAVRGSTNSLDDPSARFISSLASRLISTTRPNLDVTGPCERHSHSVVVAAVPVDLSPTINGLIGSHRRPHPRSRLVMPSGSGTESAKSRGSSEFLCWRSVMPFDGRGGAGMASAKGNGSQQPNARAAQNRWRTAGEPISMSP